MIELHQISKTYHQGGINRFTALRQIDLSVKPGQVVVFKGPSGSGKTTLLSIIGCMARPTSGRIRVRGQEVTHLPEHMLCRIRRESFGFVFQSFHLIPGVSVQENVMLPGYPTGHPHHLLRRRALGLLERFEIHSKAHQPVQYLSGGEQQRAAIARALINDPRFIIADEPTAHLDPDLSHQFLALVALVKHQGKTILMGSHDPLLCDSGVVDRVIEMRYGRIAGEV